MTPADQDAIVGAYHGDPFGILGPHKEKEGWVVRAFLPQAAKAWVKRGDALTPMERRHLDGLYLAAMPGDPGVYKLHLELYDGSTTDIEDPYRFGTLLSNFDLHLHAEGTLHEAWHTMGAHVITLGDISGVRFSVWAPNAESVTVTGDFNDWDVRRHPMRMRESGVWEIFLPEGREGDIYKYFVRSKIYGVSGLKVDPYGFASEKPPKQGSVVFDLSRYQWGDGEWLAHRASTNWLESPLSIYEVHLESWTRKADGEHLTYGELADQLVAYAKRMGYTHLELLPPMEHPFSGSWGYQVVGYFAPSARFGGPDEFRQFVDRCHQEGIGVIVDWVPAHFPKDAHGLAKFDGTALYEHEDPRQGEHQDWGTLIFNFGRNEVRNFLISSALFWLKEYHIDGLRVDAVASMLYLDYSRKEGEWVPNKYGGNENLDAIECMRMMNVEAHKVPGAITIAEESTSFAGVSRPVYAGGLGFTFKWNMGWMHDMLHYFQLEPVYRKFNHHDISFSMLYAFTENFILPISHDEVVHGKGSLIGKMPGDEWQKFANARAFLAYMYAHPGKKLLFMGAEIGQYEEWNYLGSLRWDLLQYAPHRGLHDWVKELNFFYRANRALYEVDSHWEGFQWIDLHDIDSSVISFVRRAKNRSDFLVFVCNFTPVVRHGYQVGVPEGGEYIEVLNSDSSQFFGSGVRNEGSIWSQQGEVQGQHHFVRLTLPPLGVVAYRKVGG